MTWKKNENNLYNMLRKSKYTIIQYIKEMDF
jgi:hypothetical protein